MALLVFDSITEFHDLGKYLIDYLVLISPILQLAGQVQRGAFAVPEQPRDQDPGAWSVLPRRGHIIQ